MGILGFIKDSMNKGLREIDEKILYRIRLEMWRFERKIIKSIMAAFILLLSFAVLALSASFFLIEYIHLTKTLAFLIIGIILLIIGVILKI